MRKERETDKVRKARKIPPPVYVRYMLLNAPGLIAFILALLILRRWIAVPGWLCWTLIAGWIIKDALLFPVVWRAYDWSTSGAAPVAGERGIVKRRLDPSGYVQVRGELWRAQRDGGGPPIESGQPVLVRKREGLTLYVAPDDEDEKP